MNILVIGEKCIDEFIYGNCTRLNPEAPTPIFIEKRKTSNQGMAGNVAENLKSLGGITVSTYNQNNIITKTRYVDDSSNYILLRIDSEDNIDRIKINDDLVYQINNADFVVISDYNKGFLYPQDLLEISKLSNSCIIDTKKPISNLWTKHFDFIKMNNKEWDDPHHNQYDKAVILSKCIITQGRKGALYQGRYYNGNEVEVIDVAGAGDSFLAGFSHMYVNTKNVEKSIEFGNKVAAYVVKQRGVVNKIVYDDI